MASGAFVRYWGDSYKIILAGGQNVFLGEKKGKEKEREEGGGKRRAGRRRRRKEEEEEKGGGGGGGFFGGVFPREHRGGSTQHATRTTPRTRLSFVVIQS